MMMQLRTWGYEVFDAADLLIAEAQLAKTWFHLVVLVPGWLGEQDGFAEAAERMYAVQVEREQEFRIYDRLCTLAGDVVPTIQRIGAFPYSAILFRQSVSDAMARKRGPKPLLKSAPAYWNPRKAA